MAEATINCGNRTEVDLDYDNMTTADPTDKWLLWGNGWIDIDSVVAVNVNSYEQRVEVALKGGHTCTSTYESSDAAYEAREELLEAIRQRNIAREAIDAAKEATSLHEKLRQRGQQMVEKQQEVRPPATPRDQQSEVG